jgi:[ribosomal protein S18]-alanine N-acetyltransferase
MLRRVNPYRLQPARAADAALLAAMSQQLVEEGLRPSWDAVRITWHIRSPESVVLAARHGADLVGFAIMRYADDSAHLNLLAVTPAHRRRGVARALVNWLEETALTAGTFKIALELRASNEGARAFYEALGYREAARVPGYYQGREAAIRMARDVARDRHDEAAPPLP